MNNFKSHFKFNKQERSGIFFLLLFIVILQGVYFYIKAKPFKGETKVIVDAAMQSQLDSLRLLTLEQGQTKIFPFNPNYITDYKGYALGMSIEEMDRLFAFRKTGRFVNSVEEFQKVTQVPDSLLAKIAPFFAFPEWRKKEGKYNARSYPKKTSKEIGGGIKDLNLATAEELKTIYGIGDKLSTRIIKFRDRLGGFLSNEQLKDVYGLEPDVMNRVLEKFKVTKVPKIKKININTASVEEIASFIYFKFSVAEKIVRQRTKQGEIKSLDELVPITGFTSEKINRIGLYLSLTSD